MIALYASRPSEEAAAIRAELLRAGIPCALVGPTYGHTALIERLLMVWVDENNAEMSDTLAARIQPKRLYATGEVPMYSLIRERYALLRGEELETIHAAGLRYYKDMTLFRGTPIQLTPGEARIVRLLLTCRHDYFTAEELAVLCLKTGSAANIPANITAINRKANEVAYRNMIECTRYRGYRLPPPPTVICDGEFYPEWQRFG